jgi:hypothetical protein
LIEVRQDRGEVAVTEVETIDNGLDTSLEEMPRPESEYLGDEVHRSDARRISLLGKVDEMGIGESTSLSIGATQLGLKLAKGHAAFLHQLSELLTERPPGWLPHVAHGRIFSRDVASSSVPRLHAHSSDGTAVWSLNFESLCTGRT